MKNLFILLSILITLRTADSQTFHQQIQGEIRQGVLTETRALYIRALRSFAPEQFIAPRRNYPVDFAYPQDISYTLNLKIPPGYIIAKHPDNFILTLPRDSGKFSRSLQIDGDVFQLTSRIEINKARFGIGEYGELQEFYDRIVESHAEEIVLRKQE